jgi:hypothetical protein
MLNNGDGTFTETELDDDLAGNPATFRFGDLNGDCFWDILMAHSTDLRVALNNGDNSFADVVVYEAPFDQNNGAVLNDVDDDGDLDVIAGSASVMVYLNDGAGALAPPLVYACGGRRSASQQATAFADADNDGGLDVIKTAFLMQSFFIMPNIFTCSGDLTGDDAVDTDDLFALLGAWGPCPGCPEDLTGDDAVDTDDLFALLGAWGPCLGRAQGLSATSFGRTRR